MADAKAWFRGYIASRPVNGVPYPHKVQNLVIRDYCRRKDLPYQLSATEIAVADSYMMLNDVLNSADDIGGVVLFSVFMLPGDRAKREEIYKRVTGQGRQLHAALEELALATKADINTFEDMISVNAALAHAPFGGRYDKNAPAKDPFKA